MTWGAYQAYGDPSWRLESRNGESGAPTHAGSGRRLVAPQELIASLEQVRLNLGRTERALTAAERRQCARDIERRLRRVPDPQWLERPDVCTVLGRLYEDLGGDYLSTARAYIAGGGRRKGPRARPSGGLASVLKGSTRNRRRN
jgi:hypothetical protein